MKIFSKNVEENFFKSVITGFLYWMIYLLIGEQVFVKQITWKPIFEVFWLALISAIITTFIILEIFSERR
jgi:hypothetical protein